MVDDTTRRKVLITGGAAVAGGAALGLPTSANEAANESRGSGSDSTNEKREPNGSNKRTVKWDGERGSEHATQDCGEGEIGYWHFILTRGGSTPIEVENATLKVTWDDSETETFDGKFRGEGPGALHFDVYREGGGTITKAKATFYGGGQNALLTISDGECLKDKKPPKPPKEVYWQVDFGEGANPPLPPRYWPDDGMFALGSGEDGVLENPSHIRTQQDGQLGDVSIDDRSFSFDDDDNPTEVSVSFTVDEGAETRDLHLAVFTLPGPFTEDEIDDQVLYDTVSDTYDGGDSDTLTLNIP